MTTFPTTHVCRVGDLNFASDEPPELSDRIPQKLEPWLSAIFQSEHLSLLVGNGLTTAAVLQSGGEAPSMATQLTLTDRPLDQLLKTEVARCERWPKTATLAGRKQPHVIVL